jgi:hypothetical protein
MVDLMNVDELRRQLDVLLEGRASALAERDQAEANADAARNRSPEVADLDVRLHLGEIDAKTAAKQRAQITKAIETAEAEAERWVGLVEGLDRRALDQAAALAEAIEAAARPAVMEASRERATAQAALDAAEERLAAAEAALSEAVEDGREVTIDARAALGLVDHDARYRAGNFRRAALRVAENGGSFEEAMREGAHQGRLTGRREREEVERLVRAAIAAREERVRSTEALA